ncbi:MAG: hypothetical protein R2788_22550 [Saprospiraceae bacterium]
MMNQDKVIVSSCRLSPADICTESKDCPFVIFKNLSEKTVSSCKESGLLISINGSVDVNRCPSFLVDFALSTGTKDINVSALIKSESPVYHLNQKAALLAAPRVLPP